VSQRIAHEDRGGNPCRIIRVKRARPRAVAVSRSEDYLAANEDANALVVLNEGFQSAFLAVVVLAGIGMALALLLLGRPRKAPQERLEAIPVPIQND
jgi:hypothetical protein